MPGEETRIQPQQLKTESSAASKSSNIIKWVRMKNNYSQMSYIIRILPELLNTHILRLGQTYQNYYRVAETR